MSVAIQSKLVNMQMQTLHLQCSRNFLAEVLRILIRGIWLPATRINKRVSFIVIGHAIAEETSCFLQSAS